MRPCGSSGVGTRRTRLGAPWNWSASLAEPVPIWLDPYGRPCPNARVLAVRRHRLVVASPARGRATRRLHPGARPEAPYSRVTAACLTFFRLAPPYSLRPEQTDQ